MAYILGLPHNCFDMRTSRTHETNMKSYRFPVPFLYASLLIDQIKLWYIRNNSPSRCKTNIYMYLSQEPLISDEK